MKKKKWFILLIVLIVIGFLVYTLTSSKKKAPLESSLIVQASHKDISVTVTETGLVEPMTKVEIKSKIPGQVWKLLVDEGDHVTAGKILLELDKTQYVYAVERAQASHQEAEIKLQFRETQLSRKQQEYSSKAISRHILDEAQMEKSLAEVQLHKAMIEWNAAKDDLKQCHIQSPIDGVVIHRGVEIGEMVSPGIDATVEGKPLITIADLSKLIVKSELNQIDMSKINLGQKVEIRFDSLPDTQFSGTISKISPAAVSGSRNIHLFPVEILIEHSPHIQRVKPGMTADITIVVTTRKNVLTLPIEAILEGENNEKTVQIVLGTATDYKLEKRLITVGLENDRLAEIIDGITEKEKILIKPKSAAENEIQL